MPNLPLFLLAVPMVAVGMGLSNPSVATLISKRTPPDIQGRTLGLSQSLGALARAISPGLAGWLYGEFPRKGGSVVAFVWGGALIVFGLLFGRRALIDDHVPPGEAARLLGSMLALLAIAPMIAPPTGSARLGWLRLLAIFACLAIVVIALLVWSNAMLVETMASERRTPATFGGMVRGFRTFFATRGTRMPILISCASFAGLFAYVAGSPFVLMQGYGVAPEHYGFYFALTAIAIMFGSITGGRMLRRGRSPGAMIVIGGAIQVVGGALVIAFTATGAFGLAGFLGPIIMYFFGSGITSPSSAALAMEPVPRLAGTASSAIGALTMISGSVAGYQTTRIGGSDPVVFAIVIGSMGAVVFLLAALAAALRRSHQKQHESR
jgi:DHA1 family bicyclomycin/chloramphenicol resistance-like MFS transporter